MTFHLLLTFASRGQTSPYTFSTRLLISCLPLCHLKSLYHLLYSSFFSFFFGDTQNLLIKSKQIRSRNVMPALGVTQIIIEQTMCVLSRPLLFSVKKAVHLQSVFFSPPLQLCKRHSGFCTDVQYIPVYSLVCCFKKAAKYRKVQWQINKLFSLGKLTFRIFSFQILY